MCTITQREPVLKKKKIQKHFKTNKIIKTIKIAKQITEMCMFKLNKGSTSSLLRKIKILSDYSIYKKNLSEPDMITHEAKAGKMS